VTGTLEQLGPHRAGALLPRAGYRLSMHECSHCGRRFGIYVPVATNAGGFLTQRVPCPHCHLAGVEVTIERSSRAVLVAPIDVADA
jgi:recombinational DNA repair protein (RecF pathway)